MLTVDTLTVDPCHSTLETRSSFSAATDRSLSGGIYRIYRQQPTTGNRQRTVIYVPLSGLPKNGVVRETRWHVHPVATMTTMMIEWSNLYDGHDVYFDRCISNDDELMR